MPTKKPAKKRAPRTNWKYLVELQDREIGNLSAGLNGARDARDQVLEEHNRLLVCCKEWESAATSWENRALAAEKHNAILLAERDELKNYNVNSECERKHWHDLYVNGKRNCDAFHSNLLSSPTRWQRLKSRAAKWSIEITCALAILAVFAVASWYALRWGK